MARQSDSLIGAFGRRISERLFPPPLDSVAALGRFAGQRGAFVAQTALYGYLKTRMGTKFPQYFQDEEFSAGIRTAAERVFVSCAGDLTVYAVAVTVAGRGLGDPEAAALARACYGTALATGLPDGSGTLRAEAAAAFEGRAGRTAWAGAAIGEAAFSESADAVIRQAPVIDEFKRLDQGVVRNSVRFRWIEVRRDLRRRLRPEAVLTDWRAREGGA